MELEIGHLYRLRTGELVVPFRTVPPTDMIRPRANWGEIRDAVVLTPGGRSPRGKWLFVYPSEVLHEEWPLTDRDRDQLAARILVAQV